MQQALSKQIGQLLVCGFRGTTLPSSVAIALRESTIGGVILFSRNIESTEQLIELNRAIYSLTRTIAPFVTIDHEGGRVDRLKSPFTHFPPCLIYDGFEESTRLPRIREAARIMGEELRATGFNVDWAPVVDIQSNPANPVIGDRAYGTTATRVGEAIEAAIQGFASAAIGCCAKHFPGHGDTHLDSHLALPIVDQPLNELLIRELVPFRRAIRQQVPFIMTAHVVYRAIDPDRPATLSRQWLTDILRNDLRFNGVIVSDDLDMKAITDHDGVEEAAVMAVAAGADLLLICHSFEAHVAVREALLKAVSDRRIPVERIESAYDRVIAAKREYCAAAPDLGSWRQIVGSDENRQFAATLTINGAESAT